MRVAKVRAGRGDESCTTQYSGHTFCLICLCSFDDPIGLSTWDLHRTLQVLGRRVQDVPHMSETFGMKRCHPRDNFCVVAGVMLTEGFCKPRGVNHLRHRAIRIRDNAAGHCGRQNCVSPRPQILPRTNQTWTARGQNTRRSAVEPTNSENVKSVALSLPDGVTGKGVLSA